MIVDAPQKVMGTFKEKNGESTRKTMVHKSSGLMYRTELADLLSIRECMKNYKEVRVNGRIVLDLGANVGAFSYMASTKGCMEVHSYEPEEHTYAMLVHNVGNYDNVFTYNRAVTNKLDTDISFFVGHGNGAPSLASTITHRGREKRIVRNQQFLELVTRLQPNTIKIDVEGSEYDLVLDIPNSCDELTLEWHGDSPTARKRFDDTYSRFMNDGWNIVYENKRESYVKDSIRKGVTPKWCIDAHYRR
jgi:FkbM family methyltransferase